MGRKSNILSKTAQKSIFELSKKAASTIAIGTVAITGSYFWPVLGLIAIYSGVNYLSREDKEGLLKSIVI